MHNIGGMNTAANTPAFTHDCDDCRYLGTLATPEGRTDLYRCDGGPTVGASLIARFGDEGPDYSSMPESMVDDSARVELRVAKALALDSLRPSPLRLRNPRG